MKPRIFYHYFFYKLFKLLQERTWPAFTWTAAILAMVALELWVMISLVGGVGYLFGRELFAGDVAWTFLGVFAVMLLGLKVLIFSRENVLTKYSEMFDKWSVKEHQKYMSGVFGMGCLFVLHAMSWN